jgi:ADP-L-glycero-D-manno-heptose 6-epimerase
MIVITGAAGFIGSCLCKKLNAHGITQIILVDDFTPEIKRRNWETLTYADKIQRESFFQWAEKNVQHIDFIFHLGARTDYFLTDYNVFELLNVEFSQRMWSFAATKGIPLIYASSYLTLAAPPLTSFAQSKYIFDKWTEKQRHTPPLWAGLKFFQVYGNNEEHKGKNASNIYKLYRFYNNYIESGTIFRIHSNVILDYIYVNDVVKTLYFFMNHAPKSGIYEVGTGFARPLQAIVDTLHRTEKRSSQLIIEYQENEPLTFQADLSDLRKHAYRQAFLSLEEGIRRLKFSFL